MIPENVHQPNSISRWRFMVWLLPFALALIIFCFSAQNADESSSVSNGIARILLQLLQGLRPGWRDMNTDNFILLASPYIRKGAHMLEHLALYASLLLAFGVTTGMCHPFHAMVLTFLNACSDEFHQLFVPGRHGCFTDVLIDCTLVVLVTVILSGLSKSRNGRHFLEQSEDD